MRRVIWVAWLSGYLVVTDAPSVLATQSGPTQPSAAESQPMKPRTVLDTGVKLHYQGNFEEADVYLQQAAQVRTALTPNEQAQLDDTLKRNLDAMKGRRAALDLITKTSAALEAGRAKEAEQYLKTLKSSRYLNQQDRQVVAQLDAQMRSRPMTSGVPGVQANLPVKQDPDALMNEARKACDRKDYDQAEAFAQAARAAGYSWTFPWSDNPDKVLREVAAARAKMARATPASGAITGTTAGATTGASASRAGRGLFDGNAKADQAREMLKAATQAARGGDFVSARAMVKQVEDMNVNLPVWEEYTVSKVKNEIQRAETAAAAGGNKSAVIQAEMSTKNTSSAGGAAAPVADARAMVKEARAALAQGDLDRAEVMAKAARNQHTDWGLFEDTADKVLADVVKAREQQNQTRAGELLAQARRLMDAGQLDEAEKLAWQAEALRKSYPIWHRGDRPDRLRAEIANKRRSTTKPTLPPLIDAAAANRDAQRSAGAAATLTAPVDARQQQAQQMMAQARVHLNRGEYKLALDLALQVRGMNVTLAAGADSPDQIIKAVETLMAANEMRAAPAQAEAARMNALQCLAEARLAQKQGKLMKAMDCVQQARAQKAFFQPADDNPEALAAELKQSAIAQMKVFTDAAETLASQNKLAESVEYFKFVQSLALTFNLDAAPVTARLTHVQGQLSAQAAPAAPTEVAAPSAAPAAPTTPVVAQTAPPAAPSAAPVLPPPTVAPSSPPVMPPASEPAPAVAQSVPTPAAPPTEPPTAPVAEADKGQQLLIQAQQALMGGQLTDARKLAEALYTGPYQMQTQANLLLTQIDEAHDRAQTQKCAQSFEVMQRAIARQEWELAMALAQEIDVKRLPADKQQQLQQWLAMKEMQPKIQQAQAVTPAETPTTAAQTQARTSPPKTEGARPEGAAGTMIDEVRARQEVEFQRIRETNRQAMLKASQMVAKGDYDGAIAELQDALAQVQKANVDKDVQAKLARQLSSRIHDFQTIAEKVAFSKMQKDKLEGAADKKSRIMMAKELQREEVTKLMKEYANFMSEGKYVEAENCAMKAQELDPDNVQAEIGIFKARAMRTMTDERRILANKQKATNNALNDLDEAMVPYVSDDQPVVINPKIMARAKQRGGFKYLWRNPADKETYNKLNSMVSVDFKNKPLSHVLDELRQMSGANIVPQDEFLKAENISLDYPVDVRLSNVSLKTALSLTLSKARLTYLVRDGVVLVTTQAGKQQDKITVTYQVSDLIVPRDDMATLGGSQSMLGRLTQDGSLNNIVWNKQPLNGNSASTASMAQGGSGEEASSQAGNSPRQVGQTLERQLIQLITETIEPQSWNTVSGSGNINYYPHGMTLVVSQTPDIQEQIEFLLDRLRELQELQVTVEVRFITLNEDFFERVGVDMDLQLRTVSNTFNRQVATGQFGPPGQLNTFGNVNTIVGLTPTGSFTQSLTVPISNTSFQHATTPAGFAGFPGVTGDNGGLTMGLAFLSNIQVFLFMEAVQGDARSNVLTAPKVTLFNGQTASLSSTVTEYFVTSFQAQRDLFTGAIVFIPVTTPITTGIFLTVQAVVTADRRYVQISLAPSISNIQSVQTFSPVQGLTVQQPNIAQLLVATTVQVPDGGTILMGGLKTMTERRIEHGPPVISKIPYINRLFRNSMYGREARSLLMMVTPRIIIPEEEEERLGQTFTF